MTGRRRIPVKAEELRQIRAGLRVPEDLLQTVQAVEAVWRGRRP